MSAARWLVCGVWICGAMRAEAQDAAPWRTTKSALYRAFTGAINRYEESRAGLALARQASATSLSGHPGEAEVLAERAFAVLKSSYPADHPILLEPLQILASTLLDQHKIGKARETVQKMRAITIQRPEDHALIAGTSGALLQVEARYDEAEVLYLDAFASWQRAGRGNTAEAATVLSCLGTLYIHQQRYDEAEQTLDRALAALSTAGNAVWLDRIKLRNNRAVLHGRQGQWRRAEDDMREAIAIADRAAQLDPVYMATMLTNYAQILRKNRRTAEARAVEARAASLRSLTPGNRVVDVTELGRHQNYFW